MRRDRSFSQLFNLDIQRTPQFVSFLVQEIQTVKGEIEVLEDQLQALPGRIEQHKATLASLVLALSRHPTSPDPTLIPAVRRNAGRTSSYGKMTQMVLRLMREAGAPMSTSDIADPILRSILPEPPTHDEYVVYRRRVRIHLNYLRKRGHTVANNRGFAGGPVPLMWELPTEEPDIDDDDDNDSES